MKKTLLSLAVVALLTGCATGSALREKITGNQFDEPVVETTKFLKKEQSKVAPPAGGPIPVAVYSFQDKTGQRKSIPNIASLSSAVTQGAESYLIKALQEAGDTPWFTVLERVGLENILIDDYAAIKALQKGQTHKIEVANRSSLPKVVNFNFLDSNRTRYIAGIDEGNIFIQLE